MAGVLYHRTLSLLLSTPPSQPPSHQRAHTLGVLDSGVGGLSVLSAIEQTLQPVNLMYFADTANGPYGDKSPSWIASRCQQIGEKLLEQGAQALVVACNTATVSAIQTLRTNLGVPIIGIEPAIKPATKLTQTGVIGVLATETTLDTVRLHQLIENFAGQQRVIMQPCPGLACAIEAGQGHTDSLRSQLHNWLKPMLDEGMDTLVLGCTHYPFVADVIQSIVGEGVALVHPEQAVAKQVARELSKLAPVSSDAEVSRLNYFCSGETEAFAQQVKELTNASCVEVIAAQ